MPLNPGNRAAVVSGYTPVGLMKTGCLYLVLLMILMLLAPASIAQERGVRSSLSSTTITRDESVTLTIVAIGMDAELDASSLEKDFEVVGRSSSREVNSVTGSNNRTQITSIVTWALELIPRDVGVFTVPAVTVGDMTSQIHTLTVNDLPTGAKRDIFVEATVDTQSPWVQSQVLMSVKVFQAIDIVDGGLDVPSGDDLVVERIGEDTRTTVDRDGRRYSVTERRFAVFPQKSGAVVLEPITLSVSVPAQRDVVRGFFAPTRKLTRRTDRIQLDVQPRPDGGTAWWLPAKSVQLESQWMGGADQATVDQPLTRRIVMRASGVADTQLPDINIPAIDGVSVYAEQPERAMGANDNGLLAEQIINWAVIPQRAGVLQIPAVSVDWFNTLTGRVETAELPAETLTVAAASASSGTVAVPTPPSDANALASNPTGRNEAGGTENAQDAAPLSGNDGLLANTPSDALDNRLSATLQTTAATAQLRALESSVARWRTWALVASSLWLVTSLYYLWRWRSRRPLPGATPSARIDSRLGAVRQAGAESLQRIKPLAGISASCKLGDLASLRQSLLEWAARQWPDDPPLTLDALVKRLPEGDARVTLADVNSALYSQRTPVIGEAAWQERLAAFPEQIKQAVQSSRSNADASDNDASSRSANHGLPSL